jgi:hypothetical protein
VADQVGAGGADGVEEAAKGGRERGQVAGAHILAGLAVAGQVEGVHPAPLGQLLGVEQPVVEVAAEAVDERRRRR